VGLRSPLQATRQPAGREKRLAPAAYPLAALTPASGRGKRQMPDEVTFVEALDHVRKEQRGEGLLRIAWAQQIERHPHYVGRGRGSATRAQRGSEPSRSHLTRSARQDGPMAALTARLGWQACVTNATPERLSLAEAVLCDRNEDRVERICHRLNRSSGFMLLLVRLWDVSPSRFASGLRNDAPRADCAPAPPRRALCGHAPSRGSKSDVSPDVL